VGLGCAIVDLLNENSGSFNDDYPFVSSASLTEEERQRWDPVAIRKQHELQYKQARILNRTVCVDRTRAGECLPAWCDGHGGSTAWTGMIVYPQAWNSLNRDDEEEEEDLAENDHHNLPPDSQPIHSMVMTALMTKEKEKATDSDRGQHPQQRPRKPNDEATYHNVDRIDNDKLDCVVSDDYQFVFVHTLRSGGSFIKSMLQEAFCTKEAFDKVERHCGRERLRLEPCPQALSSLSPHRPSYKVFTFVRNPYSRWLSTYTMGVSQSKFQKQSRSFPLTMEEFLNNPADMAQYTQPPMSSMYWVPQTHFFLDQRGCPVVDYIGHLETFDEDFELLLKRVLNRPPPLVSYWDNFKAQRQKQGKELDDKLSLSYRKQAQEAGVIYDERALSEMAIALIQQRSIAEVGLLGYGSHYPFY